jgi:hypothetical protein
MKCRFNFWLIMFVVFCLFGCSSFGHQSPRYVKLAHEITEKTAEKLKGRKDLFLVGTGGKMMNDIQAMDMSFDFYQEVDLKEARQLVVHIIKEYLSDINGNKEIRQYLHEYPFTAKNVEIRIFIFEPNGTDPPLDKIYLISAINGILTYYLDLPETYSRRPICKETYEDALKQVNNDG